jgi:hypothetical protein
MLVCFGIGSPQICDLKVCCNPSGSNMYNFGFIFILGIWLPYSPLSINMSILIKGLSFEWLYFLTNEFELKWNIWLSIKLNKKSPWSKWSMDSIESETCNQFEQSKIRCLIKMTNDMFSQIKHFMTVNKPS